MSSTFQQMFAVIAYCFIACMSLTFDEQAKKMPRLFLMCACVGVCGAIWIYDT
jgi:hypothetical protein